MRKLDRQADVLKAQVIESQRTDKWVSGIQTHIRITMTLNLSNHQISKKNMITPLMKILQRKILMDKLLGLKTRKEAKRINTIRSKERIMRNYYPVSVASPREPK